MEGQVANGRQNWSARAAFLCAAVGSAVGLGNVWRFPNYSYAYGGGAFFVPYTLALIFIGIPILTLEFVLGQVFRSGDVVAFGSMHKRLRGVGLGSIWCGFMVVCYYVVIIAWALTMLINSFRGSTDFPWTTYEGGVGGFFNNKVVGIAPQTNEDGSLNRSAKLVPQTWVGVTFVWLCIFLCTFRGAKLTGRITYVTMLVPFALLVFFAIFFGGLEGADDGIEQYIGKWEMKRLQGTERLCGGGTRSCDEAWPDAVAQVFFSLSITFGVMTAYASYNPPNQGVMMDAVCVAIGDFMASFVAGFVVFAGVGVLANVTGTTVESAASGSAGLGLVFVSFPSALEALGDEPYNISLGVRKLLAVLFFSMVSLLGIDSAFSLCEGFSTCIKDSRLFKGVPHEALIGAICLLGYSISFAYCDDVGIYALDSVDYYINICMLFVGYMECLSVGWIYMQQEQVKRIGLGAWIVSFGSFMYASIMAGRAGLGIGTQSEHAVNGTVTGIVVGIGLFVVGQLIALSMARKYRREQGVDGSALYDVLLFNVESLRKDMNKIVGGSAGNFSIPMIWSLLIKFFIPPVLMIMLELKFMSQTFGTYEFYHEWYQGWGMAISFLPWVAFGIGLVAPSFYDFLMPENEVTLQTHLERMVAQEGDSPKIQPPAEAAPASGDADQKIQPQQDSSTAVAI